VLDQVLASSFERRNLRRNLLRSGLSRHIYPSSRSHLALAALRATALRSLAVIVCNRRFPPTRPPLRPISDISIEICSFVGGSVPLSPCAGLLTKSYASWLTSSERYDCLIRFGMASMMPCQSGNLQGGFPLGIRQSGPLPGETNPTTIACINSIVNYSFGIRNDLHRVRRRGRKAGGDKTTCLQAGSAPAKAFYALAFIGGQVAEYRIPATSRTVRAGRGG
jgi:hypothetical protein